MTDEQKAYVKALAKWQVDVAKYVADEIARVALGGASTQGGTGESGGTSPPPPPPRP